MIELATLSTRAWPLLVIGALGFGLGGAVAWQWQGKTLASQAAGYETQLADKDAAHDRERTAAAKAALDQLEIHQVARRELEDQLQQQETTHYKAMLDAQKNRTRLLDQLATADVRLSVLLDVAGSSAAPGCNRGLRAAPGAGCVVAGATRAELDSAHAQRIVGITGDGDDGLKALQACQAYVRRVTDNGT